MTKTSVMAGVATIHKMKEFENIPNASSMMDSLRNQGYNNMTAIADLIDNSFDADSNRVDINIQSKNGSDKGRDIETIQILDDGRGMMESQLRESLKLGSVRSRISGDLGRFGMGLKCAPISIGKYLEVRTKAENCNEVMGELDLDRIYAENRFINTSGEVDEGNRKIKTNSGTMLTISRLDRADYINLIAFIKMLKSHIGVTHRNLIDSGKIITINNEIVTAIRPLDDLNPTIHYDEIISIPEGNIRLKIATINNENEAQVDKSIKQSRENQGIYVLRNNRQIVGAVSFGIFEKFGDYNEFRVEVSYDERLDSVFKTNNIKTSVKPTQSVIDKIKDPIIKILNMLKHNLKVKREKTAKQEISVAGFKNIVEETDKHLLPAKPPTKIIKGEKTDTTGTINKVGSDQVRSGPAGAPAREMVHGSKSDIQYVKRGTTGPAWDCYQEGIKTILQINSEHSFYTEVIAKLETEKTQDEKNGILLLLHCFARAEQSLTEDDKNMMEDVRTKIGGELSQYLKQLVFGRNIK